MSPESTVDSGKVRAADGVEIAYDHYKSGKRRVVVICHGFYNSKASAPLVALKDSLARDFDVFMFDLRGHGKSGGSFTMTAKESADMRAVLAFLKGKYDKIGVVAFSLGAAISINTIAATGGVDSLVCVSPVAAVRKIDYVLRELDLRRDLVYTLFTKEGWQGRGVRIGPFWLKKEIPAEEVKKIRIPILYIHGTRDWVIKPWHSQLLYDNTPGAKQRILVKDGAHAEYLMLYHRAEVVPPVREWFLKTMA